MVVIFEEINVGSNFSLTRVSEGGMGRGDGAFNDTLSGCDQLREETE
jgi:hypothetical protein